MLGNPVKKILVNKYFNGFNPNDPIAVRKLSGLVQKQAMVDSRFRDYTIYKFNGLQAFISPMDFHPESDVPEEMSFDFDGKLTIEEQQAHVTRLEKEHPHLQVTGFTASSDGKTVASMSALDRATRYARNAIAWALNTKPWLLQVLHTPENGWWIYYGQQTQTGSSDPVQTMPANPMSIPDFRTVAIDLLGEDVYCKSDQLTGVAILYPKLAQELGTDRYEIGAIPCMS